MSRNTALRTEALALVMEEVIDAWDERSDCSVVLTNHKGGWTNVGLAAGQYIQVLLKPSAVKLDNYKNKVNSRFT